jgi:hypothetical protein
MQTFVLQTNVLQTSVHIFFSFVNISSAKIFSFGETSNTVKAFGAVRLLESGLATEEDLD